MTLPTTTEIALRILPHGDGLPVPAYATLLAAGCDLPAAVPADRPLVIAPHERVLVPTGLAIALSPGFEAQIRPRSGLAFHHGVTVLNAPGTIDADYRGEIQVLLVNLGAAPFEVTRGMRIAQMVVAPVTRGVFRIAPQLDATLRADGGFGSTGIAGRGIDA